MSTAVQAILEAAAKLSESERLEIATILMDNLPDELFDAAPLTDEEWIAELNRRSLDMEGSVSWESLRDE